jgi:hypothetical protein
MPFSQDADMPDQPGQHRAGQALALAQDLDTLTGPLTGEVVKHQLTSGSFRIYWPG